MINLIPPSESEEAYKYHKKICFTRIEDCSGESTFAKGFEIG